MKIGIISDTHDRCDYIEWFLREFEREGIEMLIHLGDIVAPFAAKRFAAIARKVPFIALYGNNDGERAGLAKIISEWGSIEDGPKRIEAAGKVLVIHHYPMSAEEALAQFPDADYFLSGHTHERCDAHERANAHERASARAGRLRLINPGEACGWLTGVATAGILEPDKDLYREIAGPDGIL